MPARPSGRGEDEQQTHVPFVLIERVSQVLLTLGGSLEPLSKLSGRTLYIHMNNTNPILDAESPEAERVRRAGIEIAADGQEFDV